MLRRYSPIGPGRRAEQRHKLAGDVADREVPLRRIPPFADETLEVDCTTDLGRVATSPLGGRVDPLVALPEVLEAQGSVGGDPSVGSAAGEPLHAGSEGPEPELDRVRRRRAWVGILEAVVAALERNHPFAGPPQPDQLDRLLRRVDGLARAPARAAHAGDLVEVAARSQTKLDSAATQHVERSEPLGDHRRAA